MSDRSMELKRAETIADTVISELTGVPGLGDVRRRLLTEAGIMTRTALAQSLPEQIVSVTGMPRGTAEAAIRFAAQGLVPEPTVTKEDAAPLAEPLGEDAPQTTCLERAALRAQTAVADASRHAAPDSKLSRTLLRFARLAGELPHRVSPGASSGTLKRLTARIETITERLETVAGTPAKSATLPIKRAKRLQQRLKRTRDSIKRTLKTVTDNKTRKTRETKAVSSA